MLSLNDLLGNPVGGEKQGFANAGSLGIDLSLDFEKMACIRGLSLFSSFVYILNGFQITDL